MGTHDPTIDEFKQGRPNRFPANRRSTLLQISPRGGPRSSLGEESRLLPESILAEIQTRSTFLDHDSGREASQVRIPKVIVVFIKKAGRSQPLNGHFFLHTAPELQSNRTVEISRQAFHRYRSRLQGESRMRHHLADRCVPTRRKLPTVKNLPSIL